MTSTRKFEVLVQMLLETLEILSSVWPNPSDGPLTGNQILPSLAFFVACWIIVSKHGSTHAS